MPLVPLSVHVHLSLSLLYAQAQSQSQPAAAVAVTLALYLSASRMYQRLGFSVSLVSMVLIASRLCSLAPVFHSTMARQRGL